MRGRALDSNKFQLHFIFLFPTVCPTNLYYVCCLQLRASYICNLVEFLNNLVSTPIKYEHVKMGIILELMIFWFHSWFIRVE